MDEKKTSRRSVLKSLAGAGLALCGMGLSKANEQRESESEIREPEPEKIPIYIFPGGKRVPKEECRRIEEMCRMARSEGMYYLPMVDGIEVGLEWFLINLDTGEFKTHYWP